MIFLSENVLLFFFYFQVAICSVPIRKYNIVSSTLKRWRRRKKKNKKYLNRKYLVILRIYLCCILLNPFQNAIYQCNQYLRVNGYVMTDDLKTCVFPANKKKPWGLYRDIKFGKDLLVDATTTTYMRLPFMGKKQYVVHIYTQHCREWFYMLFWPWYIPQYKKLC